MNIRDLQYIIAVAHTKHFGKAAEQCYVSQPALSAQIKKLEDELGIKIFERTNKQVLVTPVGEAIIKQAMVILDEIESLKESAKAAHDPMCGQIKIGIIPTVAPYLLPHIIPVLHRKFPTLEPYLIEEKTDDLLEKCRTGLVDAVIVAGPLVHETMREYALYEEPFLLAVPKEHHLASKAKVKVSDIENEVILLLEEGHCLRDQALEICHLGGALENKSYRATSLETLRSMVMCHTGITLLPALAAAGAYKRSHGSLLALKPFIKPVPTRQIIMIHREHSARADCLAAIAQIIRERIPSQLI